MKCPALLIALALLLTVSTTACDDDEGTQIGPDASDGTDTSDGQDSVDDPATIPAGFPKADCDDLNTASCSLPWPSNLYLEPSDDTETGYKLTFGETSLPANKEGIHLAPSLFEGLDGYGFGTPIMFDLGPLDYSVLASEWDEGIAKSMEAASLTLLFKVTDSGLEQTSHFVEVDANHEGATLTYMRPGVILDQNSRYIVALRGLVDDDGAGIEASAAFKELRDRTPSNRASVASRRASFEDIFGLLADEGVDRDSLILAWDFHTGSADALHQRLDDATNLTFAEAPKGGSMAVTLSEEFVTSSDDEEIRTNPHIRYRVFTDYTVPSVLKDYASGDGSVLNLDENGNVALGDDLVTRALIHVPYSALEGDSDPGVIVYGHGLFGGPEEIWADHLEFMADEYNFIFVAVPMIGMDADNVGAVSNALLNLNGFRVLSDALHQGIVNHHLLTRYANSGELEAFLQDNVDAAIEINEDDVHYFGGSQGGIFGQTIVATSPDLRAGVLAVPGNNYATLLPRSSNYSQFEALMRIGYPDAVDRNLLLASIQLLWDRTDPVSYLDRLFNSEDYDGTTRTALMLLSKADYQVAVLTNEIAARTFPELKVMENYDERVPYGLTETEYPNDGSSMILFDFGNPWPDDRGSRPPEDEFGDPHPRIAEIEDAGNLLESYLRDGVIIDVCGGDGCNPD